MKILAVYNIKGGVGKTTTAVNLAYLAAQKGLRTLVWDLDPQGAASFYFRIRQGIRGNMKKLMKGRRELAESIKATDFENLDLLPADFTYRDMDILFDQEKKRTRQLLRLLRPLSEAYDLVVLDCPPSMSLISDNIFRATDLLLVPMIPTVLSVNAFHQLIQHVGPGIRKQLSMRAFFNMADRRKSMHKEIMQSLPDQYEEVMNLMIPYNAQVERMGLERAPLLSYAPRSEVAAAYHMLWQEISRLIHMPGISTKPG